MSLDSKQDICFVFSGQGNQWLDMGRYLLKSDYFRQKLMSFNTILMAEGGCNSLDQLINLSKEDLYSNQVMQPAIFLIQMVLVSAWKDLGVVPDYVLSHSMGEFAASVVAGQLTVEEGCQVIQASARLVEQSQASSGRMMLLNADLATANQLAAQSDLLWVTVHNTNQWVALSGKETAIHTALASCQQQKIKAYLLPAQYAFHCPLSAIDTSAFMRLIRGVHSMPDACGVNARLPFYSAATGDCQQQLAANHFVRVIEEPVLFNQAVTALYQKTAQCIFIEIAPFYILNSFIKLLSKQAKRNNDVFIASMITQQAIEETFQTGCQLLAQNGVKINTVDGLNIKLSQNHVPLDHASNDYYVNMIASILEKLSGQTQLPRNKTFFMLGLNSLVLMQALLQIKEDANIEITVQDVFDYPTMEKLGAFITEKKASCTL